MAAKGVVYEFSDFVLDPRERTLRRLGVPLQITPKIFDTLLYLVERRGRLVDKAELIQAVWPDAFVEEGNLAWNISRLRKILGDREGDSRFIETIPKRGYRFAGAVSVRAERGRDDGEPVIAPVVVEATGSGEAGPPAFIEEARANKSGVSAALDDPSRRGVSAEAVLRRGRGWSVALIVVAAGVLATILMPKFWPEGGAAMFSTPHGAALLNDAEAEAVARRLALNLTAADRAHPPARRTSSAPAYEAYLKGLWHWNKRTDDDYRKAIDDYGEAIRHDPKYAAAYAGLADCYAELGWATVAPKEAFPKALEAAEKAVALDETMVAPHATIARASLHYLWDWERADREFRRALDLNPDAANVLHQYSHYLMAVGRVQDSEVASLRSLELEPLNIRAVQHLGWHYLVARQYERAVGQLRKTLDLSPTEGYSWLYLGQAQRALGRREDAIDAFRKAAVHLKSDTRAQGELAAALALSGDRAGAHRALSRLMELAARMYVSPYSIALAHAGLGETDRAFESLERAYEMRATELVYIHTERMFDDLRADPRYLDLVRRLAIPLTR